MEHLLIYWSYWTILKQRDLGLADLADAVGVSRQTMSHHWARLAEDFNSRDRIEDAIHAATEKKGGIYPASGVDERQAKVYSEVVRRHCDNESGT